MPSKETLYTNIFGEPFFEDGGTIFKVFPETGDIEPVCTFAEFDPARLDDFWTGESLKHAWEVQHGPLGPNHCLVPVIPFVLGGDFEIQNLMPLPHSEANTFYAAIRAGIQSLDDGDSVRLEIVLQRGFGTARCSGVCGVPPKFRRSYSSIRTSS